MPLVQVKHSDGSSDESGQSGQLSHTCSLLMQVGKKPPHVNWLAVQVGGAPQTPLVHDCVAQSNAVAHANPSKQVAPQGPPQSTSLSPPSL